VSRIQQELAANLTVEPPIPITATFTFDTSNPFAVEMTFHQDGDAIPWTVARELFEAIVFLQEDRVGLGDVVITRLGSDIIIALSSPEGHTRVKMELSQLQKFFAKARRMKHLEKTSQIPSNREIANLLRGKL
jgi:nitrogen-specific signal transduction histidine kinase